MKSKVSLLSIFTIIILGGTQLSSIPLSPLALAIITGVVAFVSLLKNKILASSGDLVSNTSPYANYIFYGVNAFYLLWMGIGIFFNSHLIPEAVMTIASYVYLVLNAILRRYFQDAIVVENQSGDRSR